MAQAAAQGTVAGPGPYRWLQSAMQTTEQPSCPSFEDPRARVAAIALQQWIDRTIWIVVASRIKDPDKRVQTVFDIKTNLEDHIDICLGDTFEQIEAVFAWANKFRAEHGS